MGIFFKRLNVYPNHKGFLFYKNRLQKELEPGIYNIFDPMRFYSVFSIPSTSYVSYTPGQEVISKDNIALRFSYTVIYFITDASKFIQSFDLSQHYIPFMKAEELIRNITQVSLREKIVEFSSEEINEKRNEIFVASVAGINEKIAGYGLTVTDVLLKDITFPKMIQEMFSRQLEAKIRAKADLENARTQVATARALKNAADMLKENEEIKFLHYMETLTKIASKGKHTFVIGDYLKKDK